MSAWSFVICFTVPIFNHLRFATSVKTAPPIGASFFLSSDMGLRVYTSLVWTTRSLNVCFEQRQEQYSREYIWVQEAVQDTWQTHSSLWFDFISKPCNELNDVPRHIRIQIIDSHPQTLTGRQLYEQPGGMQLNFDFQQFAPLCQQRKEFCIKAITVREFGRALGFEHNDSRDDLPWSCIHDLHPLISNPIAFKPVKASLRTTDISHFFCSDQWRTASYFNACDKVVLKKVYANITDSYEEAQCDSLNGVCKNVRPPRGEAYSCDQYKQWGHCNDAFMKGYCRLACDTCQGLSIMRQQEKCDNIPPPHSKFTCEQHKSWGQCTEPWMLGSCRISCGDCQGLAKPECDDVVPPNGNLYCWMYRLLWQCNTKWIGASCRKTCGRCK